MRADIDRTPSLWHSTHLMIGGTRGTNDPLTSISAAGRSMTILTLVPVLSFLSFALALDPLAVDCSRLRRGQYSCDPPLIHHVTQQPVGCSRNNSAPVNCTLIPGLYCSQTSNNSFLGSVPCQWTNGYSFETSLLLSIFLGMFGADRFYLGYPGLALLKFCTLGFLFFGQLVDIILIAMQIVGPADGSNYVMNYFGPKLSILRTTNSTFFVPYDEM